MRITQASSQIELRQYLVGRLCVAGGRSGTLFGTGGQSGSERRCERAGRRQEFVVVKYGQCVVVKDAGYPVELAVLGGRQLKFLCGLNHVAVDQNQEIGPFGVIAVRLEK